MNAEALAAAALAVTIAALSSCSPKETATEFFPIDKIYVGSPLALRIENNITRLQDALYQPPQVFEDKDWPGDFIGREILGLTMDSQILHTRVPLLDVLIDSLPLKLNERGYMGPIYDPVINEQALSGHGWLLRGLCEYTKWTGDNKMMPVIKSIAENLFVAGKGRYSSYPISPEERSNEGGQASGSINSESDGWMLSTDIGCLFIGMAGLIDAYELLPEKEIRETIDEMIARFLQVDLAGISAQTHATLSATRGLLKYASLTGNEELVREAVRRWNLYLEKGMTSTYANYNWFARTDWTEPCAIVDSYIVAMELWRLTMDPSYRNTAELITVNALERSQRVNGGFGCESCPTSEDRILDIIIPEAYWCCTMRGAEGLARIAQSGWALKGKSLYITSFRNGSLLADGIEVHEETSYPGDGSAVLSIIKNEKGIASLYIPDLPWAENVKVLLNGKTAANSIADGFICIKHKFVSGDTIEVTFDQPLRTDVWHGMTRYFKGPLELGLRTDIEISAGSLCVDSLVPVRDGGILQVLFQ